MSKAAALKIEDHASAPDTPKGPPLVLENKRFGQLGMEWGVAWTASIPDAIAYEEILKPSFWKLVAPRLHLRSTIEATNDSLSWYAKLLVTSVNPATNDAEVRQLFKVDLAPTNVDPFETEDFLISDGGAHLRWVVSRKVDGHVMKDGFKTRDDARYYITSELTPRQLGR